MAMAFSFSSTCSQLRPLQLQLQLRRRRRRKHCSQAILATARLSEDSKAAAAAATTSYRDNWFDLLAINYLSQSVQATTGLRNSKREYERLVEAAMEVSRKSDPLQQRELMIEALEKAVAMPVLLILRESEVNGRREKNIVYIPKCRFLKESNCVDVKCHLKHLSKIHLECRSTWYQTLRIFGEEPPSPTLDPAMKQPCYKLCKSRKLHSLDCPPYLNEDG